MLRVAIYLADGAEAAIEGLEAFDIEIVRWPGPARHVRQRTSESSPDVVLIVPSVLSSPACARLFRGWKNRSVAVVVLTGGPSSGVPEERCFPSLLELGVDAVVPRSCGPAGIAAVLWSTHHQKGRTQALSAELVMLRAGVEKRKKIDQAKSIIAEQIGISEAEALRRLRHQARNQRRSMYELSKALIEARHLLTPPSTVAITAPTDLVNSAGG